MKLRQEAAQLKQKARRLSALGLVLSLSIVFQPTVSFAQPKAAPQDAVPVHLVQPDIATTPAFRIYQAQKGDDLAKIRYLINLTRHSKHRFERNRATYSGSDAARALIYKFDKYGEGIGCVKDFIEEIASYSRQTGRPYYVVCQDKEKYLAKDILYHELKKLEAFEKDQKAV